MGGDGGDAGASGMSLEEAKAVLERAGLSKKDSKKDSKKESKKKKDKKSKKEKKDSKKKDKKRKRDRSDSTDSSDDSDGAGNGGRRWKSGVESGKASAKGKDKKSKNKDDAWGEPPGKDFDVDPISEDDYFMKNHEFAAWLKHVHGVYFTDLLAEKARTLFKDFVEEWNRRRLPRSVYEGVTVTETDRTEAHATHVAMIDAARLANLKRDIKDALLNNKVIAFPIACRVAWHASGTFDARDGSGGSDGGTMRFEPERSDPANAGLGIVRDMLHEVHKKYPDVSQADIFTLAGALSIEFAGGPHVPHAFGRTDDRDGARCPAHGRLPDASQGATHLRDVFHRMGMSDRDIVALSGAHTLGRCHFVRSGYDGKWTRSPLRFDNEYFRNLIHYTWKPRDWDGKLQYTDVETGELMMLPTDIALKTDPNFRPFAELYAKDQEAFFRDFSAAYSRLLALGTKACPHLAGVNARAAVKERDARSWEFREACMHGVVDIMPLAKDVDLDAGDAGTGRAAIHKAAYWGHAHTTKTLTQDLRVNPNVRDAEGDTALHDAARFGHVEVVKLLLATPGIQVGIKNNKGLTALALAEDYGKPEVAAMLRAKGSKL